MMTSRLVTQRSPSAEHLARVVLMGAPLVLLAACSRADALAPAPSTAGSAPSTAHRMDLRYVHLGACDSPIH